MALGLRPTVAIEKIIGGFGEDVRDTEFIPKNFRSFLGDAPQVGPRVSKPACSKTATLKVFHLFYQGPMIFLQAWQGTSQRRRNI